MFNKKENHKRYMKEVWYPKNQKKHYSVVRKRKKALLEFIREIKRNGKCFDCGLINKEHPEIFDFDHVFGKKEINISSAVTNGWSEKRILKEISKCEIVCANCHRIRTEKRRK